MAAVSEDGAPVAEERAWAQMLGPSVHDETQVEANSASEGLSRLVKQLTQNVLVIAENPEYPPVFQEIAQRHQKALRECFLSVIESTSTLHEEQQAEWLDAERALLRSMELERNSK